MPDSDLYVGLAGVAVVFAGFAGISVVLTGRQPEQWRSVDAARVSTMISISLAAAFFSLLPVVVARLDVRTDSLWQICSALFLVYGVFGLIRAILLKRRVYRLPDTDKATARSSALLFSVASLGMIANALNVFRVFPARGEGLYLVALVISLALGAWMFLRTLTVLRVPERK